MNCSFAMSAIMSSLKKEDICLFTTGLISRRAFYIKDRDASFYMLGSMGLVSSVGLGIALNTQRKTVIFDGDGSVLMDMGTMALISRERPENLVHIVLDNNAYESTGNQPAISKEIDLSRVAAAVGYAKIYKFDVIKKMEDAIGNIFSQKGPVFILIKVDSGNEIEPPRVSIAPEELARRVKMALASRSI